MFAFMMRTSSQTIEFALKQLRLVTILWWGLCLPVQAQTPSFSPPSLPPLPGAPSANTVVSPMAAAPPSPGNVALPPVDMPSLAGGPSTVAKPAQPNADKPANALADLPPPMPESSEHITSAPTTNVAPPIAVNAPTIPTLAPPAQMGELAPPPSPDAAKSANNNAKNIGKPALPLLNFGSNDEEKKPKKPEVKSWQTVLAPAIIPPKTNFNYRRQILPSTVSRPSYTLDNEHLPPSVTREDYARLLANRAAANDVVATRALLNAGADNKDMALAAAQSTGARDTAQLLMARGARMY